MALLNFPTALDTFFASLPIAKALIELHGGTIRMRSSGDLGALIMIHLPVKANPIQLDLPMNG